VVLLAGLYNWKLIPPSDPVKRLHSYDAIIIAHFVKNFST